MSAAAPIVLPFARPSSPASARDRRRRAAAYHPPRADPRRRPSLPLPADLDRWHESDTLTLAGTVYPIETYLSVQPPAGPNVDARYNATLGVWVALRMGASRSAV